MMVDSRKSKTGLARLLLTFVLILGGFFAHIALFNQSYAAVGETYTLLINENSIAGYGIYDTNDTNRTGVYPILMNLNNNKRRSENVLVYCIQHGVPTSNGTRGYTEKVWSSTTIKSLPNVQWILNNSYPNKTLSSLASDATAARYPVSDLKPDQAVSATQAAIWHFTDGFNLDANQYRSVMVSTNTYVKKDGVVTYVMYQANDRNWYMLKNDGSNTIDLYKKYTAHPAIPSNYTSLGSFSKLDETNDPYTKIYSNAVSRFNQFQDNLQNLYKYLVENASYANTLEIEPQYISVTGPATTVTADKIGPFTVNNLTTVEGKINTADTRTVKLTSSDPNVVFKYADGTAVDLNAVIPNKPFYGSITSGPGSVTLKAEGATDVPIGRVFVAKGKQTLISGAPVLTNPAPAATAKYTRPKNIDIPITKIWKNANGNIMPGPESGDDVTSITVDLIQQGSTFPLQSVTLTAPNWSGKFTNIPAYNSDGKPAVYNYSERNVPKGYVCDGVGLIDPNNLSKGLKVVNKKSYGTFDFVKTSSNNYPLPGATITITDSSNKIVIQGMTDSNGKLTKPTIGSENFNLNGQISLPNGTYTITESTAPLGYKIAPPITIIIEGGITKLNGAPSSQVIMKDTEEPTSLTITKNWTSPDGTNIIDSIANQYKATFVLQQDLNKTDNWSIVYDSNNSPITGEIFGNGSYTFNNLARYNKNDTEIAYRALESAVNVPAGEGTFKEMTTPGSKNVTNQLQQENVEITVIKKWVQIDGSTPLENANEYTATFALYADGNPTGRTVTITGNNSDKFDLLPMYNDTTGKKIVYTVQETKVSGFTSSEPNVSTDGKTFTFTNKQDRNTEKITIVAQKQWALNDGTPIEDNKASNYSATFVLKANGDVVRSIEFKGNKIGQNKVNFGEYPKYDDNNVAIKYTVEEILNTAGFVSDTTLVEVPTNGLVTFVNKSTTKNLQGSIGTKVSLDGVANGNKKYDNNGRLTVIPQKATNITVTDTVSYKGLVPSEEYYLTATLNKIVDGKAIAIKTLENILQKANSAGEGTWTVNFENMTLEPDTTYVVFEKAISKNILVDTNRDGIKDEYQGGDKDLNKDGIPTLEHKNIDDFAQTIVVEPKFEGETPVGQLKTTVKVDDKVGSDTEEAKLIQKD
ncbi:Cna B-type domain-containing protein, partial [Criibacterium bergeronii]